MAHSKVVLILGKLPPPYMGPSIATQILLNSGLKENFKLVHVNTKVNADLNDIGKWSFKKIKLNFDIWNGMISKIRNHKPDLVLIPISQSTVGFIKDSIFIIIARLFRCKTLLHLRGSDFKRWLSTTNTLTKWYVKNILKSTQGIIVLGKNLRYLFDDLYPQEQIFVAPNGGDYTIPARTRSHDGKVRLLYLGNLQPSKGIEDVIDAASILKKQFNDSFEVEVIGGWRKEDVKQRCLEKAEKHALPITFFSPEMSKNKLQHLANADIFVFPPREPEGHPWVIVEAMAAGLPVVSTNQGAIVESVIHEKNGYIVSSGNANELASRLAELITDHELRQRMSAESRIKYLGEFTEQKMVDNLSRIFNAVIQN